MKNKTEERFMKDVFKMAEDENNDLILEIFAKFLQSREGLIKEGKLPKFNEKFVDSLDKKQRMSLSNTMSDFLTSKMREEIALIEFTLKFIEDTQK